MKRFNRFPLIYLTLSGLLLVGLALLILSACNLAAGSQATTPTLDVTQAYQTVEARLTQAVALTPTQPAETPTSSPTQTTSPPPTAQLKTATPPPPNTPAGPLCDQAGPGAPIDVTIPDDTVMQPGQEFTKTWRLINTGSCAWSKEYALVLFSGEELGAETTIPLTQEVPSGQSVDLSVDMQAPQTAGSYQSNWKIRNPSGTLFGIGPSGGSAFWVRIIVAGSGTITVTPTGGTAVTATPTQPAPTVTPTAGVLVSGLASMQPGDGLDLDSNQVNSGGEDLGYQSTSDGLVLQPLGSTLMGSFGTNQPSIGDCRTLNMVAAPNGVGSLVGSYLCYRTGNGLLGWLKINSVDEATSLLSLELQTWTTP
jgi:hypothetical protein